MRRFTYRHPFLGLLAYLGLAASLLILLAAYTSHQVTQLHRNAECAAIGEVWVDGYRIDDYRYHPGQCEDPTPAEQVHA